MSAPKIRYQWIVIAAAIIFVILSFTVFQPQPSNLPVGQGPMDTDDPPVGAVIEDLFRPDQIEATYETYEGGHRLSGVVNMPECYQSHLRVFVSDDENHVTLRFRANEDIYEACEEDLPQEREWLVAVTANDEATFSANYNWQDIPVVLNEIDNSDKEKAAEIEEL